MKILIICGPTATGKTRLAVSLAKKFHGELINADSRQVYRYMDIATGKDKKAIDVPIYGLDLVDPRDSFNVSQFATFATEKIKEIISRGKIPIVVGGTGFYIDALLHPFDSLHIPPNNILRDKLKNYTVAELQNELDANVLDMMNTSDRNNPRRLIRKIELSTLQINKVDKSVFYDALIVGLTASNEYMYHQIDKRVEQRVQMGVKGEVEYLSQTYGWDLPSMQTLGYKQWRGNDDDIAIQQWKYDEHKYARRQLTWFKKYANAIWFSIENPSYSQDVEKLVSAWYTK